MKKIMLTLLLLLCVIPALAEETDGDCLYTLRTTDGVTLTRRAGRMYVDDEYISEDNALYRIVSVDDDAQIADAVRVEEEAETFAVLTARAEDEKKRICMYSTHSDESYIPDDGDFSKWKNAGIYDVGNALKDELEKRGIETVYSEETFLPHDAGAYGRSRSTAEELLKKNPDALLDIHRDATPAEEYETNVDGEDISKVRLFVGRSNQNSAANKAFARKIKKTADETHPGLIKDIYIGKGNYNQELYPQALLLEFGTDEIDKDKAIAATKYIADVLDEVLYGESAKAEEGTRNGAVAKGIMWAVGLAALAAVVYALLSTGSFRGMGKKLRRNIQEMTAWKKP